MIKKFILSGVVATALVSGSLYAEENNGVFIGGQFGGGLGILFGPKADGGVMAGIGVRLGYQAFFTEMSGFRVYLSTITTWQFAGGATKGNLSAVDMYILPDINFDYLKNIYDDDDYKVGVFMGIGTGLLITAPLRQSMVPGVNTPHKITSLGFSLGLNLGLRAVVRDNNSFEFGLKMTTAYFRENPDTRVNGFFFLGAGYNYKF